MKLRFYGPAGHCKRELWDQLFEMPWKCHPYKDRDREKLTFEPPPVQWFLMWVASRLSICIVGVKLFEQPSHLPPGLEDMSHTLVSSVSVPYSSFLCTLNPFLSNYQILGLFPGPRFLQESLSGNPTKLVRTNGRHQRRWL